MAQGQTLEALARLRFSLLLPAEVSLLWAAPEGQFAAYGPMMTYIVSTGQPAQLAPGAQRPVIRAELIRWLCVDRSASSLLDPRGIQVVGARIEGPLDLSFAVVPFGLSLRNCDIDGEIILRNSELALLDFEGSTAHSISADCAKIKGSVFLRNQFHSEGVVRFLDAEIGGCFECDNSTFLINPEARTDKLCAALILERARVKGSVFLRRGFRAEGGVRLLNAQIGGDLDCEAATFENPPSPDCPSSGAALDMDAIEVNGHLLMRKGFRAVGEVRLPSAEIRGDLDCSGGTFSNPRKNEIPESGSSILGGGLIVKGSVFFSDGFSAEGDLYILGASIGKDLNCRAGNIKGQFFVQGTSIGSALFWDKIISPQETTLNWKNTSTSALVDDEKSWPALGKLIIDGFSYKHLSGDSPRRAKERLNWLARQEPIAPRPYQQLAKVLRDLGDDAGARKVLSSMERLRRIHEYKTRGWLVRFFAGVWSATMRATIGYGYHPARSLVWLLGLALLGTGLFGLGYSDGSITPTAQEAYSIFKNSGQLPPYYERFNPLMFSFESSVPLVKFGQTDHWQANPENAWHYPPRNWLPAGLSRLLSPTFLRGFRWLQVCLGWFFTTMGVASVTGAVRRA